MGGYFGAAIKGLGCYAFVIFVVVHLFVGWKFDKQFDEFVIIEYQNDPIPDPPNAIEGLPTQSTVARLLIELEESQSKQKTESSSAKSKVEEVLASYQSTLRNWDYWDSIDNDDPASTKNTTALLPEGRKAIKIVRFVTLLMKSSLADIQGNDADDHDQLTASFKVILREFQGLADHRSEVKWDIISDLLFPSSESFPAKEKLSKEDLYEQVCHLAELEEDEDDSPVEVEDDSLVEVEDDEEADEDVDLSTFLTEEDLLVHYQMIDGILEKRRGKNLEQYLKQEGNATISAAIEEAVAILLQEMKDAKILAEETIKIIKADAAEFGVETVEDEERKECHVEESVLDTVETLLETGLDAIQRKKDLRAALLEKLEEVDPLVLKDLTLDSALDADRDGIPELGPKTAINVRKIIDTPLFRHSVVTIDWFLDWVSLHSHELDRLVDKLNLPTATSQGASTGELLAAYVLQITGTLPVPLPPRVREILLQTERGRKLLTAYS